MQYNFKHVKEKELRRQKFKVVVGYADDNGNLIKFKCWKQIDSIENDQF